MRWRTGFNNSRWKSPHRQCIFVVVIQMNEWFFLFSHIHTTLSFSHVVFIILSQHSSFLLYLFQCGTLHSRCLLLPTFPVSTASHPLHNRLLPHLCLCHLPPACPPPPQHPSAPTHSQTPTSLPSSVTDSSSTVQTSPAMVGGEFHRALVLLFSRSSQSSLPFNIRHKPYRPCWL